jgi:hypothetical protein
MSQADEAQALSHLAARLHEKFPHAPPERIRQVLTQLHRQYDGRPIREFIPLLVEREATDLLRDPALSEPGLLAATHA